MGRPSGRPDILLRAKVELLLKSNGDDWQPENFLVDSGTEMTMMPASLARALDLPMPRHPIPGGLELFGIATEVRAGLVQARVEGFDATEYVFPCYFIGDSDAAADRQGRTRYPRNLLGLTGVVDQIRVQFDGTPTSLCPYGVLVIEAI